jgi:hypothetical protein
MPAVVVNLTQLREALRVAEEAQARMDAELDNGDSPQVHLSEPVEGVLRVELLSNADGQPVGAFEVDYGQAPGETGVATEVGA